MAVASAGTVIVVGGGGLDDGGVVEVEPEGAVAGFAAAEGGGADGAVEVDEGAPGGAGAVGGAFVGEAETVGGEVRPSGVNACRVEAKCITSPAMNELVFIVTQEADGGFVAEALGESIITQADTWDELRVNVREAVAAFYFDRAAPQRLRLHLVRDEVLA